MLIASDKHEMISLLRSRCISFSYSFKCLSYSEKIDFVKPWRLNDFKLDSWDNIEDVIYKLKLDYVLEKKRNLYLHRLYH